MNKAQADIEAKKIFEEAAKKSEKIIEEAKNNGSWQKGLDSNNGLFKELENETKEKLRVLASMIDEE